MRPPLSDSHQPTRQRERAIKRFTSARYAQRFLSAFTGISAHFRPGRHRLSAQEYRREMTYRFHHLDRGHGHGHSSLKGTLLGTSPTDQTMFITPYRPPS